jgi:UDP-2,4-diacetamido-2,4,6-trideoxy-beta-L-altropyranose hydrolase
MTLRVLFRADGGAPIGEGHLMRTFALAQHVQERGGSASLLTSEVPSLGAAVWRDAGMTVDVRSTEPGGIRDADQTLALASETKADWLVTDGYFFRDDFYERVRSGRAPILAFHDMCDRKLPVDIFVNQNPGAEERCAHLNHPVDLLGTDYIVLRSQLRHGKRAAKQDKPNLLITLGGSDTENLALDAASAIASRAPNVATTLICTGGQAALTEASEWARAQSGNFSVRPAGDITGEMLNCHLAITAAGTTSLELASLGVPAVLVVTADNQWPGALLLEKAGCARVAGDGRRALQAAAEIAADLVFDAPRLHAMSLRGRALVDGRGVERIFDAMAAYRR